MSPAAIESGVGLRDDLERWGRWLFRHRGSLPFLLIAAVVLGVRGLRYPLASHGLSLAWDLACLCVGLLGVAIRAAAAGFAPAGTSSRSTSGPSASTLTTTGMYSLVRHPLYLGNLFMWLAPAMLPRSLSLVVIVTLVFWLYYERIMLAEEAFLRQAFGETFESWARRTPTFFPAWKLWRRPELAFSWRTVLRREYTGLFALVATLTIVETALESVEAGTLQLDIHWRIVFLTGAIAYVVLRVLTRRTRILDVPGR